ncbi:precorrin-8X methylmutase [Ethanoligenens sp.]|uniref:precorrin-8X methylmutase n=1 Tax=Ethanoligenens sp. TaxID=2099655 RepID=UPI0039EA5226
MLDEIKIHNPADIEKKSFEIITEMLGGRVFPPLHEPIVKRVIHTTADFEYADILRISDDAVEQTAAALRDGCNIVTDTKMAAAGISKAALARWGGQVVCLISDESVAAEAKQRNITRSAVCMERYAHNRQNRIFVMGNAPTALVRLSELIAEDAVKPRAVVGVPVGFVNVVEAKKLIMTTGVPYIVTEGRKGGSTVAAAIINAVLYMMRDGLL